MVIFYVDDGDYPIVSYFVIKADGYTLTGIWSFFTTVGGAAPSTPITGSTVTELQIKNLALMAVGAASLSSLSEVSVQATVVNSWYEYCRDFLLRSHPWNFAERWANLVPIGTIPDPDVVATGITVGYGTAAPLSGDYNVGDIIWNTNPVPGGNIGWVCVVAGSPGTWKEFGIINA